uniref:F-box/LRR-repeat protein 15-like leucin rich repeat domain-containing protein n=1 Tax=Triticum aestivum TaxID=4565 RepID=A0A3B6SC06_WHEAT
MGRRLHGAAPSAQSKGAPAPTVQEQESKPRPLPALRRPLARRVALPPPASPSREPSRCCRPAASSIILSCFPPRDRGARERELQKQASAQEMAGDDARTGEVAPAEEEPHVERLPADILAHVLSLLPSFHDLSISRSCWGCHITDQGLLDISSAACIGNLTSVSLWGLAGITDKGVVHLVSRARSLQHLNIGGTFITDESLYAVADSCPNLKSIILWSCRHVTEAGLVALVNKCPELECINVGGMRVSPESFAGLKSISPALRIRSIPQILNADVQVA